MSELKLPELLKDGNSYILDWLTAEPSAKDGGDRSHLNIEKRVETLLDSLRKERSDNVIIFKPRSK